MVHASLSLRPALAAGFAAVFAGSATAAHIDFFSEGDETAIVPAGNTTQTTIFDSDGDTIPLGNNSRRTGITFAPGMTTGAAFQAQLDTGSGTLAFANTSEAWAIFNVTYGTDDGETLDLTSIPGTTDEYSALRVTFEGIEYNNPPLPGQETLNGGIPTLTVTATDTGGTSDSVAVNLVDETIQADYVFDYSSFLGVDFESLDTLDFQIDSNIEGASFTLDEIFRTNVIPEPAGLTVLGLGVLLATRRRR